MTQPGWYPDQNGGSGKKYWDGQAWHDAIPARPAHEPAPSAEFPGGPRPVGDSEGGSRVIKIALTAVLVIGVIWAAGALANTIGNKMSNRPSVPSANDSRSLPLPGSRPAIPGMPTAMQSQEVPLGTPLRIKFQPIRMDGTLSKATAAVRVKNIQQVSSDVPPPSGTYYAVEVGIVAESGTVSVNPYLFSARTNASTNVDAAFVDLENLLPATELPQGQKIAGWVVFDVPRGMTITDIVLEEPLVGQLARWTVS